MFKFTLDYRICVCVLFVQLCLVCSSSVPNAKVNVKKRGYDYSLAPTPHEIFITGHNFPINYYKEVYTPSSYLTPVAVPAYYQPATHHHKPHHSSNYGNPTVTHSNLLSSDSNRVSTSEATIRDATSSLAGMLEVPFGERATLAFSLPPMSESYYKVKEEPSSKYYGYGQELKFSKSTSEPSINIGSIIADTFVLKERGTQPQQREPTSGRPAPSRGNSALVTGILKNVIKQNPFNSSSSPGATNNRNLENIHSPGDLFLQEIPIDGNIDYSSLNNLTEFLLDETSRSRPMNSHGKQDKEKAPMFVALQYHTIGRIKNKAYGSDFQKNTRIHVVLGHKHFQFTNVNQLNKLYECVKPDFYYVYRPVYGVWYGELHGYVDEYVPAHKVSLFNGPMFYISKATVDLIIEFVDYVWGVHHDTYEATKDRAKDIFNRVTEIIRRTRKKDGKPKFRPNNQTREAIDYFTWPYTNTLAFRTLDT